MKDYKFPHMGHIHIEGQAKKVNTSWCNITEANAIVSWILANKDKILEYYQCVRYEKVTLADCVTVVTPFAAQAGILEKMLAENALQDITVRTVHRLQGAERKIVLFSTVYTAQNKGSFFFDKTVNMLNVAVSRAKDSFIVFGDKSILKKELKHLPSGLLAVHIKDWHEI